MRGCQSRRVDAGRCEGNWSNGGKLQPTPITPTRSNRLVRLGLCEGRVRPMEELKATLR